MGLEIEEGLKFKTEYVDGLKDIYVTGVYEEGITNVVTEKNNSVTAASGTAVQVLHDLMFMLNFSMTYIPSEGSFVDELGFQNVVNNNSIAYKLNEGRADIAIGYFYNVKARLKYGKPMVPLTVDVFDAYYHKPKRNRFRNVFQEPFAPDLGLLYGFTMVFIGICAVFLMDRSSVTRQSIRWKIQEGLLWAVSTISQQGFNHDLPTLSVRVLISTGTFLSILLNAYYSAAILAFLTVDNGVMTYNNLLHYGYTFFVNSNANSTLLYYADKKSKPFRTLDIDYDESVRMLFNENNAHAHLDTPDLFSLRLKSLKISAHETCNKIAKVPFSVGKIKSGFYSRRDFKYQSLFNSRLLKVKQSGLTKRYWDTYLTITAFHCPKKLKKYQDDLGIENVLSVFVFLVAFAMSSIVVLFVENYIHHYYRAESGSLALDTI